MHIIVYIIFAEFPHSRQGELVLTIRPVGMGEFCFTEDFITVLTRNILLSEHSLPASADCMLWSWLFIWSLRLCLPFYPELAFKHIFICDMYIVSCICTFSPYMEVWKLTNNKKALLDRNKLNIIYGINSIFFTCGTSLATGIWPICYYIDCCFYLGKRATGMTFISQRR